MTDQMTDAQALDHLRSACAWSTGCFKENGFRAIDHIAARLSGNEEVFIPRTSNLARSFALLWRALGGGTNIECDVDDKGRNPVEVEIIRRTVAALSGPACDICHGSGEGGGVDGDCAACRGLGHSALSEQQGEAVAWYVFADTEHWATLDSSEAEENRENGCQVRPLVFRDGPDHSDGCDHEGFDGGCKRAGHDPVSCPRKPAAGDAVRALPGKWAGEMVPGATDPFDAGSNYAFRNCADELKAALSAAPSSSLPERDPERQNTEQGLYRKFDVRRTDGSDAPDGKHHGCDYFVLDMTHDPFARAAAGAYAAAVEASHPDLAADMRERYGLAAPAPVVPEEELLGLVPGRHTYHHKMDDAAEQAADAFNHCRDMTISNIRAWYATKCAMLAAAPQAEGNGHG